MTTLGRRMVDATLEDFPDWEPGTRAAHSHGIGTAGWFEATPALAALTTAPHFSGTRVPVLARFSNGSGERVETDRATDARGLAVKFSPDTEHEADLISMTMPLFFVRTADDFEAFSKVAVPTETPKPPGLVGRWLDLLRLSPVPRRSPYAPARAPGAKALTRWADAHPESKAAVAAMGGLITPTSYARAAYHAVHTFLLRDAEGRATPVRFGWWPVAGVRAADTSDPGLPMNYLHDELRQRLDRGPVEFTLQIEIMGSGDALDDPTQIVDPARRSRVLGGRLHIEELFEDGDGCEPRSFNPCRLVPGVETSGDQILAARRAAYQTSCHDRHGTGCPLH